MVKVACFTNQSVTQTYTRHLTAFPLSRQTKSPSQDQHDWPDCQAAARLLECLALKPLHVALHLEVIVTDNAVVLLPLLSTTPLAMGCGLRHMLNVVSLLVQERESGHT